MFSWTAFIALAAKPMFRKTSVLVCEFSSASRWNSMVDRVPSTCESCFSNLFFLFNACKAAKQGRNRCLYQKKQLHSLKRLRPCMNSELLSPLNSPETRGTSVSSSPHQLFSRNTLILSYKDLARVRGRKVNLHSHKICHRNTYVHVV